MTHAVPLDRAHRRRGRSGDDPHAHQHIVSINSEHLAQLTPDRSPVPRWRNLLSLLFTVALVATVIFLWPAPLGGSTRLVIVSGSSMEPTYDFGDVVVTRGGDRPSVGDAVVFAVPNGTAKGMLVIHRIIGVDDEGYFVTQGDNRDTPDQWQLTDDDIVGQPLLHVPKGGHAVWFLQQWMVIAVLLGLLVMFLLWPTKDPQNDEQDEHDPAGTRDSDADHVGARAATDVSGFENVARSLDRVAPLANDGLSNEKSIDDDAMAEANAWLDQQLDSFVGGAAERPQSVPPVDPIGAPPKATVRRIREQLELSSR